MQRVQIRKNVLAEELDVFHSVDVSFVLGNYANFLDNFVVPSCPWRLLAVAAKRSG